MQSLSTAPTALILSPHRDDAAFSCSLASHLMTRDGWHVTVANVCTVSDYAPYLPEDRIERVEQVTAVRRCEDEHYAALMPSVQWCDICWKDAPLRLRIDTGDVLARHALDAEELDVLRLQLALLPQHDFVLIPMGLGSHIDHLLVREAATLAFKDADNIFYEDLPYASRMSSHERSVAVPPHWRECLLPDGDPGSKFAAAMCYPSQIEPSVAHEMESYCAALGHRERLFATSSDAARRFALAFQSSEGAL